MVTFICLLIYFIGCCLAFTMAEMVNAYYKHFYDISSVDDGTMFIMGAASWLGVLSMLLVETKAIIWGFKNEG